MPIIAIDTSLKHCGIAIINGDETLFERVEFAPSNQAEILPDMLNDAINNSGIKKSEIKKIATIIGPGSFTGVRVGLSFAKGLAMSINAELIGISTLEGFMRATNQPKSICAINVAGSVFMAAMDGDNWVIEPHRFENYDIIADFKDYALCGHAIPDEVKNQYSFYGDEFVPPVIIAQLGSKYNSQTNPPIPQYMRGADAKLWGGGQFAKP